jgi:hypothetical protein
MSDEEEDTLDFKAFEKEVANSFNIKLIKHSVGQQINAIDNEPYNSVG